MSDHFFPFVAKDITLGVANRWQRTTELVRAIPNTAMPFELTCHSLCEALISKVHGVVHVTGTFHQGWHPSWLETEEAGQRWIIDPYPWAAALGPLLLLDDRRTPWFYLYSPGKVEAANPEQVAWLLRLWEGM